MGRNRRPWTPLDYYVLIGILIAATILGFITHGQGGV